MSNYTRIQARVTDQAIQLANIPLIASGGQNEVRVDFTFCGKWDGLQKTAVFYQDPENAYHVLLEDNSAVVPAEVLAKEGLFYFGVFGTDEEQVRTTEVVSLTSVKGAVTFQSVDPAEPTPDIYRQILNAYGKLERELAVERARIDEFFATKGGGTLTETRIEDDGIQGTAYSNGAYVFLSLEFSDLPLAAQAERTYQCIPPELAPLGLVVFDSLPNSQPLTATITPRAWSGTEYAELTITNSTDEDVTDYVEFEGYYALEAMSIPELTDLRVGANGITYPTAGEAVRAQIAAEVVISYEEQDGAWRTASDYADVLARIQAGKPIRITLQNTAEGYECLATKVETDPQGQCIDLHTAVGVFRFDEHGTIEKVSEPESGSCVLTGSGAPTGDTEGKLGQLYMDTDNFNLYKRTLNGARPWYPVLEDIPHFDLTSANNSLQGFQGLGTIPVDGTNVSHWGFDPSALCKAAARGSFFITVKIAFDSGETTVKVLVTPSTVSTDTALFLQGSVRDPSTSSNCVLSLQVYSAGIVGCCTKPLASDGSSAPHFDLTTSGTLNGLSCLNTVPVGSNNGAPDSMSQFGFSTVPLQEAAKNGPFFITINVAFPDGERTVKTLVNPCGFDDSGAVTLQAVLHNQSNPADCYILSVFAQSAGITAYCLPVGVQVGVPHFDVTATTSNTLPTDGSNATIIAGGYSDAFKMLKAIASGGFTAKLMFTGGTSGIYRFYPYDSESAIADAVVIQGAVSSGLTKYARIRLTVRGTTLYGAYTML